MKKAKFAFHDYLNYVIRFLLFNIL